MTKPLLKGSQQLYRMVLIYRMIRRGRGGGGGKEVYT